MAAVSAVPTTSYELPPRLSRSPTPTPSAFANAASMTTPPGRTQLPWVIFGRSTGEDVAVRPSTSALPARCPALSSVQVTGNGPLCAVTPGSCSKASSPLASADPLGPLGPPGCAVVGGPEPLPPFGRTAATTSGPYVAALVLAYGLSVVPRSASPSVNVAVPAAIASSSRIAWTGRYRMSLTARRPTRNALPIGQPPSPARSARFPLVPPVSLVS